MRDKENKEVPIEKSMELLQDTCIPYKVLTLIKLPSNRL